MFQCICYSNPNQGMGSNLSYRCYVTAVSRDFFGEDGIRHQARGQECHKSLHGQNPAETLPLWRLRVESQLAANTQKRLPRIHLGWFAKKIWLEVKWDAVVVLESMGSLHIKLSARWVSRSCILPMASTKIWWENHLLDTGGCHQLSFPRRKTQSFLPAGSWGPIYVVISANSLLGPDSEARETWFLCREHVFSTQAPSIQREEFLDLFSFQLYRRAPKCLSKDCQFWRWTISNRLLWRCL